MNAADSTQKTQQKTQQKPPPRTPPTPQTPPKTTKEDSKQPEHPDAAAKPQGFVNSIIAAAVDNFITEFFSDVFTWISGMFTEMYKIFTHFVFPFFLACLSITVAFAKIWMPGLAHVTPYCPQIVMTGWWVFALYQFWFFGCYDYLNTALFCLTWGLCWCRFDQAVTANKMQITNNTQNTFTGPVMQISVADSSQLPYLFQLSGLRSQNMPQLQAGSSTNPRDPQITDAPVEQVEPSRVIRSLKKETPVDAVRAITPQVTKNSDKKHAAVTAAPAAATSDTAVVVSNNPRHGFFSVPTMFLNSFENVAKVFVKPEQGLKRGRDADETTKDQPQAKRYRAMKVPELKEALGKNGIFIPKGTLKEGLVRLAETHLARA
jgi:hypothetical protein